jgi:hypothetical protein
LKCKKIFFEARQNTNKDTNRALGSPPLLIAWPRGYSRQNTTNRNAKPPRCDLDGSMPWHIFDARRTKFPCMEIFCFSLSGTYILIFLK